MELPKKVYIHKSRFWGLMANKDNITKDGIEYTRTDAFMERALKWYCLDCECNDNCNADHKCFFRQEYKRYLEGNDNAVPPKFDNAILPDEDVTKNYRYRHYIRKMQDTFIEKAWNWIEDNLLSSNQQDKSLLYYDQFKKYLEK